MNNKNPIVSICCITYNHENFIRYAIEGFLIQKTTFPFEILIHDDASTDNTVSIIKEFAEKHSEITPIFQSENQYSKGNRIFVNIALPRISGKYIAFCEGDDYWIDPYKLQKQVDFLESNPTYSMVHSDHDYKDEVKGQLIRNYWLASGIKNEEQINCAPLLLSDQYKVATASVMARTEMIKAITLNNRSEFSQKYKMGDNQLWFHLARAGKIKYFSESTIIYRRHENGMTAIFSYQKRYEFIKNVYWQRRSFAEKYGYEEAASIIDKNYLKSLCVLSAQLGNLIESNNYLQKYKDLTSTKEIRKLRLKLFFIRHKSLYRILAKINTGINKFR